MKKPRFIAGLLIVLHAVLAVTLLNPYGPEPISDESAYLTVAKSLASRGEYKTSSLPGEPRHTKYPFLYPSLLSILWRLAPDFPSNVVLLRGASLLFGISFLGVLALLLSSLFGRLEWPALLILGLCAVNPAFLSSSTAIMSESLYLLVSYLALWVMVEAGKNPGGAANLLRSALTLASAFYVRTVAVNLLAASLLQLLWQRRVKSMVVLLATTLLFMFPWIFWSYQLDESSQFPEFTFYTSYYSDFAQLIQAHGLFLYLVQNAVYLFVGIPKSMVFPLMTDLQTITYLTAFLGFPLLFLLAMGMWRATIRLGNPWLSGYVVAYLAMLLIWPYPTQERFLLPVLPLLYYFLMVEVVHLKDLWHRQLQHPGDKTIPDWRSAVLVLLPSLLIGACAITFVSQTCMQAGDRLQALSRYPARAEEMSQSVEWIRNHTKPSDVLMACWDPFLHLYTDRKVAPMDFDPRQKLSQPRFLDESIRKHGIKYLVTTDLDFLVFTTDVVSARRRELRRAIRSTPGIEFKRVFRSTLGNYEVYQIQVSPDASAPESA